MRIIKILHWNLYEKVHLYLEKASATQIVHIPPCVGSTGKV